METKVGKKIFNGIAIGKIKFLEKLVMVGKVFEGHPSGTSFQI